MHLSIIIALGIVLALIYHFSKLKKEECPHEAMWTDRDKINAKTSFSSKSRRMIKVPDHRPSLARQRSSKIPKLIIQTNESDQVPPGMVDATNSILSLNPEYGYSYFTDQEARKFIFTHMGQRVGRAYDKLIPGAYKADLFRYCYLWVNGGIYIDMGMLGLGKLDGVVGDQDTFVAPEDNGSDAIYNAFIASIPQHPIIGEAIDLAVKNIESETYTSNPLGITGPILLGRAFKNITGESVYAGTDYGNGIRIIDFKKYDSCESGVIKDHDYKCLATRYPNYRVDQLWYNTNPHYSELWKKKKVFVSGL